MNILIVDDDKTNILVLSSMLKKEGYYVLEANNGLEAINIFRSHIVDLVLMDVMMPEMDGYQAAKEIKQINKDRFIPVIFLTAITEDKALAKCVESGGDDFLTKPYNRIILRSKIDALSRIQELYSTLQEQRNKLKQLNTTIENDIQLATHVYKSLIKSNSLPVEIFNTWLSPVSAFNGDIVLVSHTLSGGYHMMLGDFTGHGMAAALGTIPVYDIFHGMTRRGYKIVDIFTEINQKLQLLLPTGYFCAAAFASIDNSGQRLNVVNAGLPPIIITTDNKITLVESKHLPLGIADVKEMDINFDIIDITTPTKVYIYSDGLIESKNNHGELFGRERLEKIIINGDDVASDIKTQLNIFTSGDEQEDDISFVEVSLPFKSIQNNNDINKQNYNWKQSYTFDANSLICVDPVMKILDGIMNNNIPDSHKDRVYTIVTELFNNSLEHGLLELDSNLKSTPEGFSEYYLQRTKRLDGLDNGTISVTIENNKLKNGGILNFEFHDTGQGFDYIKFLEGNAVTNIYSGRGIMLVKSICNKIEYSDNGRSVYAEYIWHKE